MRLNEYFHGQSYDNESILKKPSNFTPPPQRDEHLDMFCSYISSLSDNLDSVTIQKQKDNLTPFERSALKELSAKCKAHEIVIMPADKGGAIVVLNSDHYVAMVESVFNDIEYFEPCDGNQSKNIFSKITAFCKKYKACLTKDEIAYLSKFDSKESNFYGLPKVHKSALIKQAIIEQKAEVINIRAPNDLKIRPIIGGVTSPTSHLSELVDILLKPFMLKLPSFVRDSIDLLNQAETWENDVNEEYVLVTMDISNMFMNISNSLGSKAVSHFLTKYPDLLHPRFTLEFVLDAISLVLENNVSFFNGEYRRQTHGCAMGSHKSPPYSSLAVGFLEHLLCEKQRVTHGDDYVVYLLKMLRRFLDDVFLKWKLSLGDPQELLQVMNNLDPKINFTMEQGRKVPFLDVEFTLMSDNSLSTDIFYKETDSHNYVPFYSFHPRRTLTNIPYSLARRVCTIVSDTCVRDKRLKELSTFLRKKQYPEPVIQNGIERACGIERRVLLDSQDKTEGNKDIPFVFTHNSANPQVLDLVRQSTSLLAPSERMNRVMQNKRIIAARRQPPSLRSFLFKPRFDSTPQTTRGSVVPCRDDPNRNKTRGRPCGCCEYLNQCSSFKFFGSDEEFEIRYHFTCDTMNVLYVLTCPTCLHNYIGQTERAVRDRCGDYRRAISDPKFFTQGVHKHLATCGKGRFTITPFLKINTNGRGHSMILSQEGFFIKKFKPSLNESKLG